MLAGKVLAAALSVLVFVAFAYGWYNYRSLTTHVHSITVSGLGQPTPTGTATGKPVATGTAQNILIVGVDSRQGLTAAQKRYYRVGQSDQSLSTDTIIVVHVPADGSRATLEEAVRYMASGGGADPRKSPLVAPTEMGDDDIARIVAFLKTLTSTEPWEAPKLP